jgi:hypothetical protein
MEGLVEFPRRKTTPSLTQLHYIRVLLDSAFNEKAKGMKGGLMKDKDFKDTQVQEMRAFFAETYLFPYMLSYSGKTENPCEYR